MNAPQAPPGASAGTHTGGVHKGEGYGSNRSREGPDTSSPRRRPAERGRRRAGPSRLARSKGSPPHRDDHRRKPKGNFARPRSRPHALTPTAPSSGLRPPTPQAAPGTKTALVPQPRRARKEKPRRGRGSSTGTNELRGS